MFVVRFGVAHERVLALVGDDADDILMNTCDADDDSGTTKRDNVMQMDALAASDPASPSDDAMAGDDERTTLA